MWLAGRYQEWLPGTHALVLGLGVALVAPVGDLFESFVKREARVKDSGGLFGAHGGALDRLDAVLFAAVVGYYIWAALRALRSAEPPGIAPMTTTAASWRSAIARPGAVLHDATGTA